MNFRGIVRSDLLVISAEYIRFSTEQSHSPLIHDQSSLMQAQILLKVMGV